MALHSGRNLLKGALVLAIAAVGAGLIHQHFSPKEDGSSNGLSPKRGVGNLVEIQTDVFKEMDGGVALTPDEIKGRNTWILWTADNDQFWDWLAGHSFGTTDLLKLLDSRKRRMRFKEVGLVNEPGFTTATSPNDVGLWLDERKGAPTEEEQHIDSKVYGRSSGVVGLRLFANPAFDEKARQKWDAKRYYNDPNYYNDPHLIRPYRVGMACGFCHVSPDPVRPPADPENPKWSNLSSYVGNQYMKVSKVFGTGLQQDSFVWQLLNSAPRGTLDTSFIATDHLNNPGTMNALYNIQGRLDMASDETLAGGALSVIGTQKHMKVPRILKEGADSIGLHGALARVFVNIGEFSDEWLKDMNNDPLVGQRPYRPFPVSVAQSDSPYWRASEGWVDHIAGFFLKAAKPYHLAAAPGGKQFLTQGQPLLKRGKIIFADNCASCHSSKQPPATTKLDSPPAQKWFEQEVQKGDFLEGNSLSDEQRHPVSVIQTNATRALATNCQVPIGCER